MPKGKKFNAAETHFIERESRFNLELSALIAENERIRFERNQLSVELGSAKSENMQLHDWIERLLEYTELSKEDIKNACKKDAEMARFFSFASRFAGRM